MFSKNGVTGGHRTLLLNSGIYEIRNTDTRKLYIGSSKSLTTRKREHFHRLRKGIHANKHLQSSFIKNGEEAFQFKILAYCEPEILYVQEQRFLDHYKSYDRDKGFNMCKIAESLAGINIGRKCSESTKKKISAAHKGRVFSKEHKEKLSKAAIDRKHTEDSKKRMSEKAKNRQFHPKGMRGKSHSVKTKEKIAASTRARDRDLKGRLLKSK